MDFKLFATLYVDYKQFINEIYILGRDSDFVLDLQQKFEYDSGYSCYVAYEENKNV